MPISVTSSVFLQGWHSWPGAPLGRGYLASLHRHMFQVSVEMSVPHLDRAVEFHDLQEFIRDWWGPQDDPTDRGSCEAMAVELADRLATPYLMQTVLSVSVGEDGENWATWRP